MTSNWGHATPPRGVMGPNAHLSPSLNLFCDQKELGLVSVGELVAIMATMIGKVLR